MAEHVANYRAPYQRVDPAAVAIQCRCLPEGLTFLFFKGTSSMATVRFCTFSTSHQSHSRHRPPPSLESLIINKDMLCLEIAVWVCLWKSLRTQMVALYIVRLHSLQFWRRVATIISFQSDLFRLRLTSVRRTFARWTVAESDLVRYCPAGREKVNSSMCIFSEGREVCGSGRRDPWECNRRCCQDCQVCLGDGSGP